MISTSVDVIVDQLDKNPYCFHGPSLLFKTISSGKKEYFACSAYRDRKDCSFYLSATDRSNKKYKESQEKWEAIHKEIISEIHNEKRYDSFSKLLNFSISTNTFQCKKKYKSNDSNMEDHVSKVDLKASKTNFKNVTKSTSIGYCHTCKVLVEDSNKGHLECMLTKNLTEYQLTHPTEILIPKEESKAEAQYFFKHDIVEKIVSIVLKMNISRILCIGTPRIHEYILNNWKGTLKSLLLDIDQSYYNFYNSEEFIWYNMFNNFIFDKNCQSDLLNFLKSKKLLVLMDPPFGGRVEPLANTLETLNKTYEEVNGTKNNDPEIGN